MVFNRIKRLNKGEKHLKITCDNAIITGHSAQCGGVRYTSVTDLPYETPQMNFFSPIINFRLFKDVCYGFKT